MTSVSFTYNTHQYSILGKAKRTRNPTLTSYVTITKNIILIMNRILTLKQDIYELRKYLKILKIFEQNEYIIFHQELVRKIIRKLKQELENYIG